MTVYAIFRRDPDAIPAYDHRVPSTFDGHAVERLVHHGALLSGAWPASHAGRRRCSGL